MQRYKMILYVLNSSVLQHPVVLSQSSFSVWLEMIKYQIESADWATWSCDRCHYQQGAVVARLLPFSAF